MRIARPCSPAPSVVRGARLSAQTIEAPAEVVIRDIVDRRRRAGPAGAGPATSSSAARGSSASRPAGSALPPAKTTIEGRGKVAMPGLIDAPVRLGGLLAAPRCKACWPQGITDGAGRRHRCRAAVARWRQDLNTGRHLRAADRRSGCGAGRRRRVGASSASPATRPTPSIDAAGPAASTGEAAARARRCGTVTWIARGPCCLDGLGAIAAGRAGRPRRARRPIRSTTSATPRAIDAVVFRGEVLTHAHVQMLRRGTLPLPTPSR